MLTALCFHRRHVFYFGDGSGHAHHWEVSLVSGPLEQISTILSEEATPLSLESLTCTPQPSRHYLKYCRMRQWLLPLRQLPTLWNLRATVWTNIKENSASFHWDRYTFSRIFEAQSGEPSRETISLSVEMATLSAESSRHSLESHQEKWCLSPLRQLDTLRDLRAIIWNTTQRISEHSHWGSYTVS